MSVRIQGGLCKGMVLSTPKGNKIRPTASALKRRVFDSMQTLHDINFIDLCAGSGAVGFEACSRGATKVWLVESNPLVADVLKRNRDKIKEKLPRPDTLHLVKSCCMRWIFHFIKAYSFWSKRKKKDTIIFMDPPYEKKDLCRQIMNLLLENDRFYGQIWLESDEKKGIPLSYWKDQKMVSLVKSYHQGDGHIAIFSARVEN